MLLTICLDESGTYDTSPISVMAGYLGTAEQWSALARRLRSLKVDCQFE